MDFLINSHKKTNFMETVSDHELKCWIFFPLCLFPSSIPSSSNWVKELFFFVAFDLLRVVLAFKQNMGFGGIIIFSTYPSEELSNLSTLSGHFFCPAHPKG